MHFRIVLNRKDTIHTSIVTVISLSWAWDVFTNAYALFKSFEVPVAAP